MDLVNFVMDSSAKYSRFSEWIEDISDKRVKDWPLMSSPWPTLCIAFMYGTMVRVGPKLMENQKPFELKWILVLYNLFVSLLNLYICGELYFLQRALGYNWECQPVNYSSDALEMRVAAALWWYYFSKFVEMADTVFFILRKKDSQLTFLHVYHHSTMFMLWWIGIKYVAGGSAVFGAMFNSLVHVLMYLYYCLTALGPRFRKFAWWKQYLTVVQLCQFMAAMMMGIRALIVGCDFPQWMQYSLVLYMMSFLVLFSNFYRQTYLRARHHSQTKIMNSPGHANGVKKSESFQKKDV
ncbi:unnamed protein product [Notodromas monacha]|uniref:Elongation of very long chain fatty acids protein n=1 Tax=Notodromas monacha TaxID=399045 RepID=A0A7R9GGI0_9CRUS|nr:unnamed protein product [Notodromas monacha]CAG0920426.1 unnamed protein product [Notodromas monacha]